MSEEFMCGGDEVRLGETLRAGGEDGGDRLLATGALLLDGKGAPDEGGDELVGGGDPNEVLIAGEKSGSEPEPAGPG